MNSSSCYVTLHLYCKGNPVHPEKTGGIEPLSSGTGFLSHVFFEGKTFIKLV